uniref:Uncharacterized protein n=1 Tax=Heliothis virescens TaxID=7102 RepID=A0A2A4JCB3_HELVI
MVKQFTLINDHLTSLENKTRKDKLETSHAFYIITSAIAAERMAQNLKDIQESLINTLINMYQGHIDVHLLSPTLMQSELNRIARLLPRDSTLPEVRNDIRDIYRLFRIHAHITQHYLLMEIKVPILSDVLYELNRLVSIPQLQLVCGTQMTSETLRHSGLITLRQGCNLQGDSFTLHAHMEHTRNILVNEPYAIIAPSISPINNIINTSIRNSSLHIETHEEKIDTQLRSIEEQTKLDISSSHDVHHYVAIYVVVTISIALFVLVTSVFLWRKIATQRQGEGPHDARNRSRRREVHDIEVAT